MSQTRDLSARVRMYATVHLGQALVKAVPIPGLCHGVTQPTSHHIGFSHKKTSSRCVAKASQAAPPSGMPPQNASQVLREKEVQPAEATTSGRKIVFAVDGTVDAEEGLRWLVKQVARKGACGIVYKKYSISGYILTGFSHIDPPFQPCR